ncbi:SGNH/GDSL hydrolase family protein [Parapedobacter sp. GCM10030251]|uniref:SGNH/GDSL hydrolase family protein n=1 Tax=Parapedobacter sp. GCM10030251 TaxID=3273419 RepID=UPI003610E479
MSGRTHIATYFALVLLVLFSGGCGHAWAMQTDTLRIVAFGNSTTATRPEVRQVYPERLQHLLEKAGVRSAVFNAGTGGSHTGSLADNDFHKVRHGRERFGEVLAQQADWVVIWFGINDAWVDDEKQRQSRIPLEVYKRNLNYFIDEIRKQGGKVILMTPNPLGSRYEAWRSKRLARYRNATIRVAAANDVKLVDVWQLCTDYAHENNLKIDDLLLDGMHPNDRAHELIAKVLLDVIETN